MKTAMVFGATGLIGLHVVELLLNAEEYDKVIVISRRPTGYDHPKIEEKIIDFSEISLKKTGKADIVFCCLGTTINKAGSKEKFRYVDYHLPVEIAKHTATESIPRLVVVSSIGATTETKNFYLLTKGEMERDVSKQQIPYITFVRPSLLLGSRKEFRFGEEVGKVLAKLLSPFMFGGLKKYKAIHAEKVARAMLFIGKMEKPGQIYENDQLFKLQ